jgi:hypothetical protein
VICPQKFTGLHKGESVDSPGVKESLPGMVKSSTYCKFEEILCFGSDREELFIDFSAVTAGVYAQITGMRMRKRAPMGERVSEGSA